MPFRYAQYNRCGGGLSVALFSETRHCELCMGPWRYLRFKQMPENELEATGMFHGNCPRCSSEISQENRSTGQAMCSTCGWTDPTPVIKAQNENEKKTIIALIVATVVMGASYAHLVNWGYYALKAPFMQAGALTGMLSSNGYREYAQACIAMNKWSCAKSAYLSIYKSNGDLSGLAELAHLHTRLNETPNAIAMYDAYIKAGGKSGEALIRYGKALETAERTHEALKIYEEAIAARPDMLPVEATSGIVRILMKHGSYEEAHDRILAFHASAGNAKGFLNTELTQLENYFEKNGRRAKRVAARK